MRVKFWGTRGTRPTPGRRTLRYGGNTTCIEVRDEDENLIIIDSGSGIAELGAGLSQDSAGILVFEQCDQCSEQIRVLAHAESVV